MKQFGLRAAPTATLRAIVALILPEYPALEPQVAAQVEDDVARYVSHQIDSMPSFLRLPYRLTLCGFAILPVLRYGRRLASLPPPKRAAYLAFWTDAPLSPMRDFIKLIRSTALLVFFDHPLVADRLDAERRAPGAVRQHHAANE